MKTLIVGRGEIGSALIEILKGAYEVDSYDIVDGKKNIESYDIIHICIPYTENFVDIVKAYLIRTKHLIVHSSIPVGTCEKIGPVVYSPVRGRHPRMVEGLRAYVKYLCHDEEYFCDINEVSDYFSDVGIMTKVVKGTKTGELMKLLELCRYGTYIAFAKEQERICKQFGVNYDDVVTEYETTRNIGLQEIGDSHLRQPILYPFKDYVGGHCTVEDMEILLKQVDCPMLKEAHRIDRGTVVWPNSNVYATAKIGKGCSIGQFCEIGNNVIIGNNVRIGAYTFIPEGVTIEDDVFIAPRVAFSNDKHPPSSKASWGKIVVRKGAIIGMGSVILPGVTIGEKALVGAGSVVTKNVPDGEIWYGVAASSHGVASYE